MVYKFIQYLQFLRLCKSVLLPLEIMLWNWFAHLDFRFKFVHVLNALDLIKFVHDPTKVGFSWIWFSSRLKKRKFGLLPLYTLNL